MSARVGAASAVRARGRVRVVAGVLALTPALAAAQQTQPRCTQPTGGNPNRPFPVCAVRPVITRGPYLSAPTDTSAIITWMTDLPSHSRVIYGAGDSLNLERQR